MTGASHTDCGNEAGPLGFRLQLLDLCEQRGRLVFRHVLRGERRRLGRLLRGPPRRLLLLFLLLLLLLRLRLQLLRVFCVLHQGILRRS